ncbi:MAG: hypothetical protein WA746_14205, partial [Isosphaeraceae bacterium]
HEGRSWRGFHHHACLVMLAYGFLALEQSRAKRSPARPRKKGVKSRRSPSRRSAERFRSCWHRCADTTASTTSGGL